MKLPICDITPFSLQDFPEYTSCILWFGGCNMRCLYCHNPELVTGKKQRMELDKVWEFLNSRKGLLDGVVLSGGECTLTPNLSEFIKELRKAGFKVKLDTNGTNPQMLEDLLKAGLLDYVALDYKAPKDKFKQITKIDEFDNFHKSLELLCNGKIEFEIRTTVHSDLLNENDINSIINDLEEVNYRGVYYIQNFIQADTIEPMSQQTKLIEINNIKQSQNFATEYRNFPALA